LISRKRRNPARKKKQRETTGLADWVPPTFPTLKREEGCIFRSFKNKRKEVKKGEERNIHHREKEQGAEK